MRLILVLMAICMMAGCGAEPLKPIPPLEQVTVDIPTRQVCAKEEGGKVFVFNC